MTSVSLSSSSLDAQKENEKINNERQLVVTFFGHIERKQKKQQTSFFLGAQKQDKKKMTMNVSLLSSSISTKKNNQ